MKKGNENTTFKAHNLPSSMQELAKTAAASIGPKGKKSAIQQYQAAFHITKNNPSPTSDKQKDGKNKVHDQFLMKAAKKTSDETGNGSHTTTILTHKLLDNSLKHISTGVNGQDIKSGIEAGAAQFTDYLQSITQQSLTTEHLEQIATTAAHGDEEIGKLISEAFDKTEVKDGLICIKRSSSPKSTVQATEDISLNSGYLSPHSADTEEKIKIVYEDPYILLTNYKVSWLSSLSKLMDQLIPTNRPLLIIANTKEGEALPAFIINTNEGRLRAAVVKAPNLSGFNTDILEDLAILSGGRLINKEKGDKLEDVRAHDLGSAEKVEVMEDFTSIVNGRGSTTAINKRKDELCELLQESKSVSRKERIKERMTLISGGIAIVNLAASTGEEFRTKEAKAQTAIRACRAALEEGIVPGGGVPLIRAHEALHFLKRDNAGQDKGIEIFRQALLEPGLHMAENGETNGKEAVEKILGESFDYGYNISAGRFEPLLKAGIADATKVLRLATENAVNATVAILEAQSESLKAKAG